MPPFSPLFPSQPRLIVPYPLPSLILTPTLSLTLTPLPPHQALYHPSTYPYLAHIQPVSHPLFNTHHRLSNHYLTPHIILHLNAYLTST